MPEPVSRRSGRPTKEYFGPEVHAAIIRYQGSAERHERDSIYTDKIRPAFEKLVENLIFIYDFTGAGDTVDELKSDCVTFLYESLHKFKGDRGTKAFSYFNVVAKHWLIIKSKQKAVRSRRNVSLDEIKERGGRELEILESGGHVEMPDSSAEEPNVRLAKMLVTVRERTTTDNERACIDSIAKIVERIDEIDILNKRALFLYIREMTDMSPKQLSSVMSVIRRHYRDIRAEED